MLSRLRQGCPSNAPLFTQVTKSGTAPTKLNPTQVLSSVHHIQRTIQAFINTTRFLSRLPTLQSHHHTNTNPPPKAKCLPTCLRIRTPTLPTLSCSLRWRVQRMLRTWTTTARCCRLSLPTEGEHTCLLGSRSMLTGTSAEQTYVSPSDNIMSPCTAKLSGLKSKHAMK